MMIENKLKLKIIIGLVLFVGWMEGNLYIPSFADIMFFFNVDPLAIQAIISYKFIGMFVGSLIFGTISDRFGRKPLFLFALFIFFLGSLGTLLSQDYNFLLLCRLVQGIAFGGSYIVGILIIYDQYSGVEATKILNALNGIVYLAISFAPILGGFLNAHYGFRSNFLFVTILAALLLVFSSFYLTKHLPEINQKNINLVQTLRNIEKVMTNLKFWLLNIIIACLFSIYFAYSYYISLLFVNEYGISRIVFPWFLSSLLLTVICSKFTANLMINSFGYETTKKAGISILAIGGMFFIISGYLLPRNYYLIHLGMLVFYFGVSWVSTPCFTDLVKIFTDLKGTAGSISVSSRLIFYSIYLYILGSVYNQTIYPLILSFTVIYVLVLILFFMLRSK